MESERLSPVNIHLYRIHKLFLKANIPLATY